MNLDSIRDGVFVDQLSDYQLLKKVSAPLNSVRSI
jgi:hypothetical protein